MRLRVAGFLCQYRGTQGVLLFTLFAHRTTDFDYWQIPSGSNTGTIHAMAAACWKSRADRLNKMISISVPPV